MDHYYPKECIWIGQAWITCTPLLLGKGVIHGVWAPVSKELSCEQKKRGERLKGKRSLELAQFAAALNRTELLLFPDRSLHFPATLTQALLLPVL